MEVGNDLEIEDFLGDVNYRCGTMIDLFEQDCVKYKQLENLLSCVDQHLLERSEADSPPEPSS